MSESKYQRIELMQKNTGKQVTEIWKFRKLNEEYKVKE